MKVLVLLSGGLDSATVLHLMLERGYEVRAVGFDYGQPHAIELRYARQTAERAGVPFEVVDLPYMPKVNDVVFAGRNAVLLSVAAGMAQVLGFDAVAIGCNWTDRERFPDCRAAFMGTMGEVLSEAYGVGVMAPLLQMTKAQVVQEARRLSVPETWSCYAPNGEEPCGECLACRVRKEAGA